MLIAIGKTPNTPILFGRRTTGRKLTDAVEDTFFKEARNRREMAFALGWGMMAAVLTAGHNTLRTMVDRTVVYDGGPFIRNGVTVFGVVYSYPKLQRLARKLARRLK